ncbi:lymphoid-specific helicase-like [Planococcus citri]|uniref:lymphoid-specific helicase-like n=1 Tax=Planococcus citri TaxID=170843 RepID=UPI0031F7E1C1
MVVETSQESHSNSESSKTAPCISSDTLPSQNSNDSSAEASTIPCQTANEGPVTGLTSDQSAASPQNLSSECPSSESKPDVTDAVTVSNVEENSNDAPSTSSSSVNNEEVSLEDNEDELALLPSDVVEEEKRCMLETEQALSELAKKRVVLPDKEKEKRYKQLMTLLGKSGQYATYMSNKLIKENELKLEESKENESTPNKSLKRKSSTGKKTPAKKMKKNDSEPIEVDSDVPRGHYRNKLGFVVSERQPATLCGGVMRDYQLDGLEWLVTLFKNAVNGILADEMGLGKTIQVIALLSHLREKGIYGPHLIIAPLSTLPNWLSEFAVFSPDIPVMLFHGNDEKRNGLKRKFANIYKNKERTKIPVILTSYEMPLRDKKFFTSISWSCSIVDEGHRLKNYKSMLSIELRKYKTESRFILTGTPLQNNLTELWSLLNYLIPEIFDDLSLFESLFDFSDLNDAEKRHQLIEKEKEEQIISKIHKILEPFLLRRMKCDVNIELPRKKEVLVYAPLSTEQQELYIATMNKTLKAKKEIEEPELIVDGKVKRQCTQKEFAYNDSWDYDEFEDFLRNRQVTRASEHVVVEPDGKQFYYKITMQNRCMQLRKIVNHPYLVKCPVVPGTRDIIVDEDMIPKSGKLLVLDALLPKLKATGHKVLLFSTFKILLDIIEDYSVMRDYKYVRLDGNVKIEDRLEAIKQFNSDPDTFIFLISTRAGGLGINLTAADTVIIFDSDWNPQVDLQAQDRCHRIGQTRPVVVYRLVTSGTIDQRIVDFATGKRRLEKLIVKKGHFKQQRSDEIISIAELQELLDSTDHKNVVYPNGLVLSDDEINRLLDRSDLID